VRLTHDKSSVQIRNFIFLKLPGPLSEVIYTNMQNQKNFTLKILPEILFSLPLAMYFPKNHFLASIVDAKVKILHSAGLIDFWISRYLKDSNNEILTPLPKMLTLEQLAGGIYVLLGGLTVSALAFFIEIFISLAKEHSKVKK
jgi:hypothetical protein